MSTFLPWALAALLSYAAVLALETRWPLRRMTAEKPRRNVRNVASGSLALLVASPLHVLLVGPAAEAARARGLGLLNVLDAPWLVETVVAVVLLDYTLWHWHRLNHRVPVLWRFHAMHHADVDMDASTGLRFHFGEHALSAFWRLAQVALIGPDPHAVVAWQVLLAACVSFHHGNLRLPLALERRLVRLIVTPRMHGIHHSIVPEESSSNYSSLLSVWDLLHGTLRLNVPQDQVEIGVAAWRRDADVRFLATQLNPFARWRGAHRLAGGDVPARVPPPTPAAEMAA